MSIRDPMTMDGHSSRGRGCARGSGGLEALEPRLLLDGGTALSWSTYVGAEGEDRGYAIAVDAAGDIYVTGRTTSAGWASGGFDTEYGGGYDVFVAKLTSYGGPAWSTYMGGAGNDVGQGIAVDDSGGVYVTGATESADWMLGDFGASHGGGYDVFVAKLTSAGEHVWSKPLGGAGDDVGEDIVLDDSGGVYVTGMTESPGWVLGDLATSHNGGRDIFVVRLTTAGGDLWSTYMGGAGEDWGSGIAVDGSGGVYVTGGTASAGWASGGFNTTHGGQEDIFVAKLTSMGGRAWSTYMGGSGGDNGRDIAVAFDGVYITGGTFSSGWVSGGFDTSYDDQGDIIVAKLTLAGQHAWSTYMGDGGEDWGNGIALGVFGEVYVTGETSSDIWASEGFDTSHNGAKDAFVARLSSTGGHTWSTYMGGDEWDYGNDIAVTLGGMYITGQSNSSNLAQGGGDTTYDGQWDAFVGKIAPPFVFISDAGLDGAVRDELNMPSGILTGADLLQLTFLNGTNRGISDLSALEHAQNLRTLYVGQNTISDISVISRLIHLEELDISDNAVSDISPVSALPDLAEMWINSNYLYLGPGSPATAVIDAFENRGTVVAYDPQREPGDALATA